MGSILVMFITVSGGIIAGYYLLAGLLEPDADRVRSRLAQEFDAGRPAATESPLFKDVSALDLEAGGLESEGTVAAAPSRPRLREQLDALVAQARVPLTLPQLALVALGAGFGFGLFGLWLGGVLIGMPLAVAASLAPLAYVHFRVTARREQLLRQLPAAFDLMSRVLRAGSSVPQALQAIADSFEDPIAGEFAHCQAQLDLGLRPDLIYQEMARRSGIVEMRIFVMAMTIQRQTGGNLSEVLDRLAALIRSRLRLRQQVRSLTAEGRMQGAVLAVLPFFVYGIMWLINREYAVVLLEHGWLLAGTGAAMLVGTAWIRGIVNIDP